MTEVRFYHLQRTTLERALPRMLHRTVFDREQRAVVMVGSTERAEALNAHLWTYDDRSFLPHGSARDGNAADHPVWLTPEDENPNGASVLFLTDGASTGNAAGFEMVVELFDGGNEEAVAGARQRWKAYKQDGHAVTYWQQDNSGRWQQQA